MHCLLLDSHGNGIPGLTRTRTKGHLDHLSAYTPKKRQLQPVANSCGCLIVAIVIPCDDTQLSTKTAGKIRCRYEFRHRSCLQRVWACRASGLTEPHRSLNRVKSASPEQRIHPGFVTAEIHVQVHRLAAATA